MKKFFLYTALLVMGIMGALLIGVVDASIYSVIRPNPSIGETVTITYDANGGVFSDSTTGKTVTYTKDANNLYMTNVNTQAPNKAGRTCKNNTLYCMFDGWYTDTNYTTEWLGVATDTNSTTKTVYAKWLGFDDLDLDFGNTRYTIMDRNLGASQVAQGTYAYDEEDIDPESSDRLGKYYQWGNNYGFDSTTDTYPQSDTNMVANTTSNTRGPNNYYSSSTFIKSNNSRWDYENNANLWGGALDTYNMESTASEGRQGPCPEGYHIPSTKEWNDIYTAFTNWKNDTSTKGGSTFCKKYPFAPHCLAAKLKLPFAGWRNTNSNLFNQGTLGAYWSSSYFDENRAYYFDFNTSSVYPQGKIFRAYGCSIRCLKDSPNPRTFTLRLNANTNGGTTTTGSIKVNDGDKVNLNDYTAKKTGWDFVGWNRNSGAHEAISENYNAYPVTEDITLYAIFKKEGITLTGTIISNGASVTPTETGCNTPTIYNNESVVTECTLTFPTATRTNGTVYGYSTNSGTDSPTITNGGTYNISANTTFYVISKGTLTGTFYKNGNISQTPNGESASTDASVTATCDLWNTNTECNITTPTFGPASGKTPKGYTTDADVSSQANPTYISTNTSIKLSTTSTNEYYAQSKSDDIVLHINYLSGVGVQSIGNDSDSCTLTGTWNSTEQATSCTVTTPSITLKNGYGTGKWSTGSNEVNPGSSITLTTDDTYTASATPNDNTQYKVQHYFENIDGTGFDIDNTLTDNLTGTTDTHTGAEYKVVTGFTGSATTSGAESSGNIAGDGSLTLNLYYTRNSYTLTFDSNSGSTVDPITAKYQSGIVLPESKRTGYTFTGWKDENDSKFYSGDIYTLSGNTTLTGQWIAETYIVTFDVNSGNALTPNTGTVTYGVVYGTLPTPTRDGYSFNGWFTAATNGTKITSGTIVSATGNHTLYAQWTQDQPSGGSTGGGSGGGGGGGGSTKTTTKTTTGTVTTGAVTTGAVTTGTVITGTNETNIKSDNKTNLEGKNNQNNGDKGENQKYSDEMQRAYEFSYKHGITTMDSIEKADMEGPLTRIAMAKMLSYYAINVLGQKPDETRVNKFNDVSDKMNAEYNNAVSLAYQLGIMGINMKNNKFRPNDLVTRAEFGTALSRMLYKIADGKDKYYSTHLAKLMEEKIITNDDPKMKELRGYVMIMLMRSAENKNT